ncbi:MAG: DUF2190 family protein [Puniceicoccales bacterium]|jgi:hypothetical protein|nr:DUF2190 family protein [Puniceicoccales bacterium]
MDTQILANIALGTHEDSITKCAKTAIKPYRLVVLDEDDEVAHSSANGIPFGVSSDEAAAGEIVAVDLLGCSNTIRILAAAAIEAGELLIPGNDGKVLPMPTTVGTYNCIGIALATVPSGEATEVLTALPYPYAMVDL